MYKTHSLPTLKQNYANPTSGDDRCLTDFVLAVNNYLATHE